jgi:hypothetical protein
MGVYVDQAQYRYGRMLMCHLLADSPAELHAMVERIGVARRWYQHSASTPHYDIAKGKRALALRFGAIEVDRTELAAIIHRIHDGIRERTSVGLAWAEDILHHRRARGSVQS